MNFTYPFFLWGLFALIIPIIIHLFNFRKVKRIQFSNVSILESVKKKSASNMRLRHLLLLVSRMFFVFFLIITFAQPFIPSTEEGFQGKSVLLYIDNSMSMSNLTSNDISAFNEALSIADQIVTLYQDQTAFHLYDNDFRPSSNAQRTKSMVEEKLSEVELSATTRSGMEVFSQLNSQSTSIKRDIFILSDFQASTIGQLAQIKDSVNTYHLIPIQFAAQRNIYVDTLYLSNPFLIPNQENFLYVRLKNDADYPVTGLSIKLFVNGQRHATHSMDIDAYGMQQVQISIPTKLSDFNACKISFEDFPIAFDNEYYFTLNQISKIKLAEITEKRGDNNHSPVFKVFEDNSLFDIKPFDVGNIAYQSLDKADVLILNEIKEPSEGLISQVNQQLKKGKTVIYIPSADLDRKIGLNITPKSGSTTDTLKVPLDIPDMNHPFFKNIFESMNISTKMPITSVSLQWHENGVPLLKTKTGNIFLSQILDQGNLFVFASPFSDAYTDFHKHGLFVPVLQRIAELSSTSSQSLAYSVNAPNLVIAVDSIPSNQQYKLVKGTTELIPSQRLSNNQLLLNVPKYMLKPGQYDLTLGDVQMNLLSFNGDKQESILAPLPMDAISAKLGGIKYLKVFDDVAADSFTVTMKEQYHSRELWKYALILSLIFLLIESALIRYLK